jgi:L-rhamnose mutarotase
VRQSLSELINWRKREPQIKNWLNIFYNSIFCKEQVFLLFLLNAFDRNKKISYSVCNKDMEENKMIFELRIYHIAKGKEKELHKRFKDETFALFEKHGIHVCDFWEDISGEKLYYICDFENEQKREELWSGFKCDDEWIKVKSQSEINGSLVDKVESILLNRVDYVRSDWQ